MTAPMLPWITVPAQETMRLHAALFPEVEHSFACDWDLATATLSNPRFISRGNESTVGFPSRRLRSGDMVVHNHVTGALMASERDIVVSLELEALGIGFGICDAAFTKLFVVIEPPVPRVSRTRSIHLGRLWLAWWLEPPLEKEPNE